MRHPLQTASTLPDLVGLVGQFFPDADLTRLPIEKGTIVEISCFENLYQRLVSALHKHEERACIISNDAGYSNSCAVVIAFEPTKWKDSRLADKLLRGVPNAVVYIIDNSLLVYERASIKIKLDKELRVCSTELKTYFD